MSAARSRARLRVVLASLVATSLLVAGVASAVSERWVLPAGDGEVLTLLLLGGDEGPPRSGAVDRGNADGFQLLFVSGDRQAATFVSIPRDSYVTVAGQGRRRINACLFGGPERCVATVASEFGVEVDGYLLTSMRGFAQAVERFGGLDIDVPQGLRVGSTGVAAGAQRLDGQEALVYGRDRKNRSDGDLGRSRAQAELLAQAHRQVVEEGSTSAVLAALRTLRRGSETDLSGPQLARLAFEALQLDPDAVSRVQVPSRVGFAGPASVVFLEDGAYGLIQDAAEDGRIG